MYNIAVPWSITGILLVVLIILFLNPDKVQIWSSIFAKRLAYTNSYFARRTISGKIQGMVSQFAKSFDNECNGIMPYSLKIEWVREADIVALMQEEGVVLVKISHEDAELNKALALAMLKFSSKSLIPNSRPYLSDNLVRSIDLVVTKKMLHESKQKGSLDYFLTEILKPEVEEDTDIQDKCQIMEILDEQGYFSRILIREYKEIGSKMYPKTPDDSTVVENNEFLMFIDQIAKKALEEDVELEFKKKNIRIAVLLVAKSEIIAEVGFEPYLKRLETHQKNRLETVYLCAREDNIAYARKIAEMAENRGLGEIVDTSKYRATTLLGRSVRAICITFSINIKEEVND